MEQWTDAVVCFVGGMNNRANIMEHYINDNSERMYSLIICNHVEITAKRTCACIPNRFDVCTVRRTDAQKSGKKNIHKSQRKRLPPLHEPIRPLRNPRPRRQKAHNLRQRRYAPFLRPLARRPSRQPRRAIPRNVNLKAPPPGPTPETQLLDAARGEWELRLNVSARAVHARGGDGDVEVEAAVAGVGAGDDNLAYAGGEEGRVY